MAQSVIATAPASEVQPSLDTRLIADLLVEAIIQVESAGNSREVGRAGERGLMQIKRETWRDMTRTLFGAVKNFDQAFDAHLNRRVGKAYLAYLQAFLLENRTHWRSDERALLLAAYNAGPARLKQAKFDLARMPETTQSYVERVVALHEYYLQEYAEEVRQLLVTQLTARRPASRGS